MIKKVKGSTDLILGSSISYTQRPVWGCVSDTRKITTKELPSRVGCSADKGACGHTLGNKKKGDERTKGVEEDEDEPSVWKCDS